MKTTTVPTTFAPDPSSAFLGVIPDLPLGVFDSLPAHPAQRQTALHAVDLLRLGILNHQLDIHREVGVVLTGNLDEVINAFAEDPVAAVIRYGVVLNGHTRRFIWRGLRPAPRTVRLVVYGAADNEASLRLYNAIDALPSVKGKKDEMQSTLNVAGIEPVSELMRKASNLSIALQWATAVLTGSGDYKTMRLESLDNSLMTLEREFYRILPRLGAVQVFKDAIVALDGMDVNAKTVPVTPAPFLGAYLAILHRNPDEGRHFIEKLGDPESGIVNGELMDSFALIKNVRGHFWDLSRARLKPEVRMTHVMNVSLNAFEGWLADPNYTTSTFPTRPNAIRRFEPVYAGAADAAFKAQQKARDQEKERQIAARAAKRSEVHQAVPGEQPPVRWGTMFRQLTDPQERPDSAV